MPDPTERLEKVAADALATSLALGLVEPDVAAPTVRVPIVDDVRVRERALAALGKRLRVDERVAAGRAEEVEGVVGARADGGQERRVVDREEVLVRDRRLALVACRGEELVDAARQLLSS